MNAPVKPPSIARAWFFELQPRKGQAKKFERFGGAARYAWNWTLRMCEDEYEASVKKAVENKTYRRDAKGEIILGKNGKPLPDAFAYRPDLVLKREAERRAEENDDWIERKITRGKNKGQLKRVLNLKPYMNGIPPTRKGWLYYQLRQHRDTPESEGGAPWLKEIFSQVYGNAASRVDDTYQRFWGGKGGRPKFKRRSHPKSFTMQPYDCLLDRRRQLHIPMVGWVRVEREDPKALIKTGKPISITVSKRAGRWFCSVTVKEVEAPAQHPVRSGRVMGVDLGVNAMATIARSWRPGEVERVPPPRAIERVLVHIQDLSRRLALSTEYLRCATCKQMLPLPQKAKNKKGQRFGPCTYGVFDDEIGRFRPCGGKRHRWKSKRGHKLVLHLQKLHFRAQQIRDKHLHRLSDRLTQEGAVIVTEGHHVQGLVSVGVAKSMQGQRKRDRRREMLDIAWGEFRRQLHYKSGWRGGMYLQTERGKPTDMPCAECQTLNKMPDDTSSYECSGCGNKTTRQENTAWWLVGYGSGERSPGVPGGDPGHGRDDALAAPRESADHVVEETGANRRREDEDVPGGRQPPGEPRKRRNARKGRKHPRRSPRARKEAKSCP